MFLSSLYTSRRVFAYVTSCVCIRHVVCLYTSRRVFVYVKSCVCLCHVVYLFKSGGFLSKSRDVWLNGVKVTWCVSAILSSKSPGVSLQVFHKSRGKKY